jgi:L-rhamnose mutarotase
MEKIAFRMQLKPGALDEYRRHHDEIWPELCELLHAAGISDYSIHHDPETDALFAVLWRSDDHGMERLPEADVMQRWWDAMAPFLVMTEEGQPRTWPLHKVFHLSPPPAG